ncbi:MAG: SxtJ family membrane protein [Candidatus Omnitrophica bacterium]|nr:SxtJ family membrane protein [Candidatus Omnitrophota bacterium]
MEKPNPDNKDLKSFGIAMGIAFLAIAGLIIARHRHSPVPAAIISAVFIFLALIRPLSLKPVYMAWMKLAFLLSWFNTRLILLVIFYLVFAPVGMFLRLLGIDLLDRKIDKTRQSYWQGKEEKEFSLADYEKRF